MKWFWKINYLLSIYLLIIILFVIPTGTTFYSENKWFVYLEKILTVNSLLYIFTMVAEWFQFPICLIILILKKDERTKTHLLYLLTLIFLNLFKWILWFFAISGVVKHAGEG
jgi:hypothetical protein